MPHYLNCSPATFPSTTNGYIPQETVLHTLTGGYDGWGVSVEQGAIQAGIVEDAVNVGILTITNGIISSSISTYLAPAISDDEIKRVLEGAVTPPSLHKQPSFIDSLVEPYCKIKGVWSSFKKICDSIPIIFSELQNYRIELLLDPEVRSEKIVFHLIIKGEIETILDQEDLFYKNLNNILPIEHRQYFSIIYSLP